MFVHDALIRADRRLHGVTMRAPFRGQSRRWPMAAALGIASVYVLAFNLLLSALGPGVTTLSGIPVVGIGWLLGLRGGLLAGLLFFPLNALLLSLGGYQGASILLSNAGLPASIALVAIGALVGKFSDLGASLRRERTVLYQEVIERKRAEAALRESEEHYRAVVENTADAISITVGLERVYVNRAFLEIHALEDVSQVIGTPVDRFALAQYKQEIRNRTFSRQRGEDIDSVYEYEIRRADGEVRTIESASVRTTYKERPAGLSVLRDVTQRKRAEEALLLRAQEMEALVDIANILVRPECFEEKCNHVLEKLAYISQGDRVILRLADEKQEGLHLVASAGAMLEQIPPVQALSFNDRSMAARAFQQDQPIVANDYPSHQEARPDLIDRGVRSTIALPIQAGGHLLGVVTIASRNPGHFTPERISLVTAVANGIGTLLENAQLQQEIVGEVELARQRLKAIQEAASKLALETGPDEALQYLVDAARQLVQARYGGLALRSDQGDVQAWFTSGQSQNDRTVAEAFFKGLSLRGSLDQTNWGELSIRLSNLSAQPDGSGSLLGSHHVGSFLGAPIVFRGRSFGTLYLVNREGADEFSADDERRANLIAVLAGVHLENARLYKEMTREQSTLAAIQASMTEGLVVLDSDGRTLYRNRAIEAITGWTDAETLGNPVDDLYRQKAAVFESKEAINDLRNAIRTSAEAPKTVEVTLVHPQRRELSVTAFPIPTGSGEQLTGLTIRDVTRERELERRRDAFVAVASHELRTPMTTILGFAELLLNRKPSPAMQREWLERLYQDSKRLATIVDDLLNVSRIQAGGLAASLEELIVRDMVDEVVDRIQLTTNKHEFLVDLPPDIPQVVGDRHKLGQVLSNLIDNAVKYSPAGGLITVSARHQIERQWVVVAVSDQGIGIAPQDHEHLFTTFYRIDRPENEGVGGSGLGLFIVKGLVELMDGEVWLESKLGAGSTFLFSLPAAGRAPGHEHPSRVGEPVTGQRGLSE